MWASCTDTVTSHCNRALGLRYYLDGVTLFDEIGILYFTFAVPHEAGTRHVHAIQHFLRERWRGRADAQCHNQVAIHPLHRRSPKAVMKAPDEWLSISTHPANPKLPTMEARPTLLEAKQSYLSENSPTITCRQLSRLMRSAGS